MGPSWAHAFIAATLITLACTPLLRRVALATDFVDHPAAAHKSHKHATPYLGGIGLITAVLAGLLFTDRLTPLVTVVAFGGALIGCLGLLDDHLSIGPVVRFGFEAAVAGAALALGLRIHATDVLAIDSLLTIIWIVGVTNAVNFLDNMDGLAAAVAAAAATAIFALAVLGEQLVTATLAAGLVGACIGFLFHNKRPASIFMGDTGSLFLGFVLGVTSLAVTPALTPPASFAVPLMLLALPVLDTVTVTICRLRRGRSVALGGKDHLSHRLVARGLSRGGAVAVLVVVEALVGLAAVAGGRAWVPLLSAVLAAATALAGLTVATVRAPVYEEPVIGFPTRLKRVALLGVGAVCVVAAPGTIALARAHGPGVAGADAAAEGLDALSNGDAGRARALFAQAGDDLARADTLLTGPLTSLGLLFPGLRANLATSRAVVSAGQTVTDAGASLSAIVDASNLALGPASEPMASLGRLTPALSASAAALDRSVATLAGYDRPYLLPPLQAAVRDLRAGLAEASSKATVAADAARLLPVMLGTQGPRRYFLAVQDSAELRGSGGVPHVWGELTAEGGRLRLSRFGAVDELNNADQARNLTGPADFLDRYRQFDVANTWQNVNVSPDFAVTGIVISTLYPQSGGGALDGVIAVDLPGLAAILELTGPVEVDGWPAPVTSQTLPEIFLRGAHERFPVEADYKAFVMRLSRRSAEAFTTADLKTPAHLTRVLGSAVRGGHLRLFSPRAEEERLFERMGAAGRVPALGGDSLLVVNQNLTALQTDSYLRRQIRYDVQLDPHNSPAAVSGRVEVRLRNEAPAQSPTWIAGAENRTYVSVYSPFGLENHDGDVTSGGELGHQAHTKIVSVPPQQERTVALDLRGNLELGSENWYHLDLPHQPTLSPDEVELSLTVPNGWRVAEVRGLTKVGDRHVVARLSVSEPHRVSVRLERTAWSRLWSRLSR